MIAAWGEKDSPLAWIDLYGVSAAVMLFPFLN